MSTNGIVGFVVDGQVKLTYNHSDSYPGGLGSDVLKFLQDRLPQDFDRLLEQARVLEVIDQSVPPTAEQKERLASYADLSVSERSLDDWYCLLRNTQGDLDLTLEAGVIADASAFGINSLFCEWGYVIDLDQRVLYVYEGFKTEVPAEGLWAGRPNEEDIEAAWQGHLENAKSQKRDPWLERSYFENPEYKGCAIIAAFPFADGLPDDETFLKVVNAASRYPDNQED